MLILNTAIMHKLKRKVQIACISFKIQKKKTVKYTKRRGNMYYLRKLAM